VITARQAFLMCHCFGYKGSPTDAHEMRAFLITQRCKILVGEQVVSMENVHIENKPYDKWEIFR
jgi:hypothetical protein